VYKHTIQRAFKINDKYFDENYIVTRVKSTMGGDIIVKSN